MDFEIAFYSEKFGYYFLPDEEEPIGWDSLKIILRRHEKFHGIFPEVSLKLTFFCGARNYIIQAYDSDGIEAIVKIYVFYSCNDKKEVVYEGILDFRDLVFTERFVECNIKQNDCTQLFLDRIQIPVNLYDEPCFTELTFDKTAYRTRYKFCPYWIAFPEKSIYASIQWKLKGCPLADEQICDSGNFNYSEYKQLVRNKFQLNGGLGCSLLIAVDPADPTTYQICGNTDLPENNDNDKSQFFDGTNHIYYIVNGVALEKIIDDISFLNVNFLPQGHQAPVTAVNNMQFRRDCGNSIVTGETPWQSANEYNGRIGDCACCPDIGGVPCSDYVFNLDIVADTFVFLDIVEGLVEWYQYETELVMEFGNAQIVLATSGRVTENNNCAGWDDDSPVECSECGGSPGCLFFSGEVSIPACDVPANSMFRIYTRTKLGFKAGGSLLGNSNLSLQVTTLWKKNDGILRIKDCIPDLPRVGETSHPVYMVHEAFSRIVEHYTNNCLRVKSNLFARANSMEWGDNCEIQNTSVRYGAPYFTLGGPEIRDDCGNIIGTEFQDFDCGYALNDCDCDNPAGFPYCNSTFDITPYQVNNLANYYFDEAFTTITSGISLRDAGTACNVSFEELFDAINAIYCIGVGYSEQDPDNLHVERIDYFYNPEPILDLGNIDLYQSKFKVSVKMDEYFNKFTIGYNSWLQDEVNTIDEFNTKREYSLPIKNTENSREYICNFISSGYSIEWQRRQRYTVDSNLDNEKFIICVGRSLNVTNTTNIILPSGSSVTVPCHIYRVETGVSFSSNILDPETIYNFRISPYAMARHWAPVFSPVIWHKLHNILHPLEFVAGEANYKACGEIIDNNDPSVKPAVLVSQHCENDNIPHNNEYFSQPEEIEFNFPLSLDQFLLLRAKPYNAIIVNKKPYFLKQIEYSFQGESKLTLIKARKI
jgi:hypothetical protein